VGQKGTPESPTATPSNPPGLNSVLARNIQALMARRREEEAAAGVEDRVAHAITAFTGSLHFVYVHVVILAVWLGANLGWISILPRFDPQFVWLPVWLAIEAIFLSTFVLIKQNRMAAAATKRADLDLQINLLTEHELTRLISVVSAIAKHMGVATEVEEELDELKGDVAAEAVLDEIETATEADANTATV
jgi:uncharacterized membrane protein